MQLNNSQLLATCHRTGPALVLAGPGSGKTRVITERIHFLAKECNINPSNILTLTFTRAAAKEMRDRYESEHCGSGVYFGTFHSLFFLVLKKAYGYSSSDILKETEKYSVIKNALNRFDPDMADGKDIINDIISEISYVKSMRYDPENYYSLKCSEKQWKYVYRQYENYLRCNRKIDFDDMMVYAYDLFVQRKDILASWQKSFKYILVDEFQDINRLQYDIVKMLAAPENNLFCVGDDDQSIYGFRGSDPKIMSDFTADFPSAKKYVLDINYRCSGNITSMASKLISHNRIRFEKNVKAYNEMCEAIDIRGFETITEQNRTVMSIIRKRLNDGLNASEMAVLYRTNMQPQPLINMFLEYNINIRLKEGVPNIYNHFIAKDIVAYIKLAKKYGGMQELVRIINKPKRYISKDAIFAAGMDFDAILALYEDKPWISERILLLENDLKELAQMKPRKGLVYISRVMGYDEYLREYADFKGIEYEGLAEIYDNLCLLVEEYDTYEDWLAGIEEYEDKLSESAYGDSPTVSFMTLHGSKGLEFEEVFIIDVNEDVIPCRQAVKEEEIEEERRLLYVGMTRAKKRLHLFYTKNRRSKSLSHSRFIDEITDK